MCHALDIFSAAVAAPSRQYTKHWGQSTKWRSHQIGNGNTHCQLVLLQQKEDVDAVGEEKEYDVTRAASHLSACLASQNQCYLQRPIGMEQQKKCKEVARGDE
jgi:hypothetical protein